MTAVQIDHILSEGIKKEELKTLGLAVEQLLDPVSPDNPCGEDLSDDPDFAKLNRLADPKAKALADRGSDEDKSPETEWAEVALTALKLLQRSKDLRIAVHLTRALFNLYGFPGLRDGLAVIQGFVEQFWDCMYPQVDPVRLLALQPLKAPEALAESVKNRALVSSPKLGNFSLHHFDLAMGKSPPVNAPKREIIESAFKDCKLEDLQSTSQAIDAALEHLKGVWGHEKTRASQPTPDYLMITLQKASGLLKEWLKKRAPVQAGNVNDALPASNNDAPPKPMEPTGSLASDGEVHSRTEAVRLLDTVCDYFEHHEPSSPVPLLLRRAQRLANMDFMGIMRDLVPAGLPQAEAIRGSETEKSASSKKE